MVGHARIFGEGQETTTDVLDTILEKVRALFGWGLHPVLIEEVLAMIIR